jgi:hypothetical protein
MGRHSFANIGDRSPTAEAREHNNRIHLTRWPVTALAEKHRRSDHHLRLPGPRRPQPAGDANVGHAGCTSSSRGGKWQRPWPHAEGEER